MSAHWRHPGALTKGLLALAGLLIAGTGAAAIALGRVRAD
jgi:hypothetical protein